MTSKINQKIPTVDASNALAHALEDCCRLQNILMLRIQDRILPTIKNQTSGGLPKRGKEELVHLLTEQSAADRELVDIIDEQRIKIRAAIKILDNESFGEVNRMISEVEACALRIKPK